MNRQIQEKNFISAVVYLNSAESVKGITDFTLKLMQLLK